MELYLPALPILLPLGAVLMIGSAVLLARRGLASPGRLGAAWLTGWYAVAVLGATLLPMRLAWGAAAGDPELSRIILVPLVMMLPGDFVLNIVMTVPLAAVLYLFGVYDRRRVVLTGLLLSVGIEVLQAVLVLTLHGNRWADVNDLIANTLGALLGFALLCRLRRAAGFRRLIRRCRLVRRARVPAPAGAGPGRGAG